MKNEILQKIIKSTITELILRSLLVKVMLG